MSRRRERGASGPIPVCGSGLDGRCLDIEMDDEGPCHPRFRGAAIASIRAWCEQHDRALWTELLSRLPAEHRALVKHALAFSWQPADLYPELVRTALTITGPVTPGRSHDMGRWIADHELPTIHKIVIRFLSPQTLVTKCVGVWKHHHNTGRWDVQRVGDRLWGDLHDWAIVDELTCGQVSGYIEGLVGRVGGPETRVDHTLCRARGDDRCRFEVDAPG